jgi:hypothetical protein
LLYFINEIRSKPMRDFLFIVLILFSAAILKAATVSGFITRDGSGEPLQYVNVRVAETQAGMQTNKKGYYVLTSPIQAATLWSLA